MGRHRGEYPPEWSEITLWIKGRTGWRCERCNHPHAGHWFRDGVRVPFCNDGCLHKFDGKNRILTVAHLDNNKSNSSEWNLAALCQVCHLQTQGRITMEQAWMFEHSSWMKPHVEGMKEEMGNL